MAVRAALAERRARVAALDDLLAKTPPEDWRDLPQRRQLADMVWLPGWHGPVTELHAALGLTAGDAADVDRVLARAILLHTDVAVFDSLAAARTDSNQVLSVASQHFGMAMALVDLVRRETPASDLPRLWYRAVATFLREHLDVGSGPMFMRRAVSFFPNDPRLLLLAGILHEFLASTTVQAPLGLKNDPNLRTLVIGDDRTNLRTAQDFLRRAVDLEPGLVEARLRLGRVTTQLGDPQKGLDELNSALSLPCEPRQRFYAWLFSGQAHAALDRREAARSAYRAALQLFPDAQSASIALAYLERRHGDGVAATQAVQRVLSGMAAVADDPWIDYANGPVGIAELELQRLRQALREGGLTMSRTTAARLSGTLVCAAALSAWVVAQDKPTFSTKVEAVRVDVLVTEKGRPVAGLTAEDFEVFDNGVRQQPRLAAFEQMPINVTLALDASNSVVGDRSGGASRGEPGRFGWPPARRPGRRW